ncbi:hypothetical protein G7085_10885 [Tessaracoccus sp. HDW20]|uniref:hypothetical protein n=1 Tax=Tessaracoccus coleopterorum TaxID=2714950 RepID=UPI0018D4B2C4|nr:hypothetical protein [Tessaracoccus coleopterorum]NHB84942.1 hypothetical protein [Tessaracoccus coleopterorum]
MKANAALQIIFAFFLGLVVVAFVGIGVNTFYPEPDYPSTEAGQAEWASVHGHWALVTGIVLLVCATLLLAVSLLLPGEQAVISNGVLLGGVFTMIYAVAMTFSADTSIARFAMITVALAVTILVGYLRFVRGRRPVPAAGQPDGAAMGELGERLTALEEKLDALGRVLRE